MPVVRPVVRNSGPATSPGYRGYIVCLPLFMRTRMPWLARIQRKPLLTANEAEFFHRLHWALPAYQVFPQVYFAALLTDDGKLSRQARWSVRARFDRKIADFVIYERGSLQVVAPIELDDRTHLAGADHQRDVITKAADFRRSGFNRSRSPRKPRSRHCFSMRRHGAECNADGESIHLRDLSAPASLGASLHVSLLTGQGCSQHLLLVVVELQGRWLAIRQRRPMPKQKAFVYTCQMLQPRISVIE